MKVICNSAGRPRIERGFDALMAGKHRVVTGSFTNKVQSAMGRVLPEQAKAQQHRKLTEPGSAEKKP